MVTQKRLDEKARIEADMQIKQKHYNEWYDIYKKSLKRLKSANKSNQKIINSI